MKRWESWEEYRATRRPAPEHGIKVKKAGSTWWGQRWIEALQHVLQGDARRLERGRSYARAGRTHDLEITAGKVLAKVTGTRPEPYRVTMQLSQLADEVWQGAIAAMAAQAQFSAELLVGEMPQAIDDAFRAAGGSLFPEQRSELVTSCSCPDWGDPCKHVAAAHYVLGDAFDRDPFLLFELRGRSREQVLEALRRARGGGAAQASATAEQDVPQVQLSALDLADYERPRAELPSLSFSFDAPARSVAVLRQLGVPGSWSEESSPAEAFAPTLQRAAQAARRLALGELGPALPAREASAPEPGASGKPRAPGTRTGQKKKPVGKKIARKKKRGSAAG